MKGSVRWFHWSLPIILCYAGRTWKFRGQGIMKRISPLRHYEQGDEKEVCTWIIQIGHQTIWQGSLSVEEYMKFDLLMILCELIEPKNRP